jgi:hypothetical protein
MKHAQGVPERKSLLRCDGRLFLTPCPDLGSESAEVGKVRREVNCVFETKHVADPSGQLTPSAGQLEGLI